MSPFATYAPFYWAAGLPAIPLTKPMPGIMSAGKRPAITGWSQWCSEMPPKWQQEDWLTGYGSGNIGLALGQASKIMIVDIDTDDPHLQNIIESCLPSSPWKRIGRKGACYAYRYNGQPSFQIKDETGQVLVEVLSHGKQVVLPPSIHPDTGMPYIADRHLFEVLSELHTLPTNLEDTLRTALIERGGQKLSVSGFSKLLEFIPKGTRDNRMISEAGTVAIAVQRGQLTLKEALDHMDHWCMAYMEQNDEDPIDPLKGKLRIVQFLTRDVKNKQKRGLAPGWDAGLSDDERKELGLAFTEDDEDWTYERLQTFLRNEFILHAEDDAGRSNAIRTALEYMARSSHISDIDRESLIGWMATSSRLRLAPGVLRNLYRDLTRDELEGDNHTEIAKAVREHLELGSEAPVRYNNGYFYRWEGSYWEIHPEWKVRKTIAENFGTLRTSIRSSDHQGIYSVLRTICNEGPLKSDEQAGINFANGYLTENLLMKEHHHGYGCTYRLSYNYRPELADEKHSPMFQGFLQDIWGEDPDFVAKKQALREAIAVTMFGQGPRFSRAIVLYNAAHGGKTTLLDIVSGLMPDGCASHIPPSDWNDKFKPANMAGKLLNVAGDLSESAYINGEMFKLIVEGGMIQGQHKGQPIFEFRPVATHWFASNHLPQSRDTSGGFLRRWLIFKFDKKIPAEKKIIHFATKVLAAERDAIAAWAVPAIQDIAKRSDFEPPHSHWEMISEIANKNNSVRYFVTQCDKIKLTKGIHEVGKEPILLQSYHLFKLYQEFCLVTIGKTPVNAKTFDLRMQELGPELGFKTVVNEGTVRYDGIRIAA